MEVRTDGIMQTLHTICLKCVCASLGASLFVSYSRGVPGGRRGKLLLYEAATEYTQRPASIGSPSPIYTPSLSAQLPMVHSTALRRQFATPLTHSTATASSCPRWESRIDRGATGLL